MTSTVLLATEFEAGSRNQSLIILQSLIRLLREKSLPIRDVEELRHKGEGRAEGESQVSLPCCAEAAQNASGVTRGLAVLPTGSGTPASPDSKRTMSPVVAKRRFSSVASGHRSN